MGRKSSVPYAVSVYIYVYVAPKLPWKLSGKLVYHHFLSAEGSLNAGLEFDALLKRKLNKYFSVLTKFAYFDGESMVGTVPGEKDRWLYWLEMNFRS